MALFALFTASVSTILIGREFGGVGRDVTSARAEASQGRDDQARTLQALLEEIARLRERLEESERNPKSAQ